VVVFGHKRQLKTGGVFMETKLQNGNIEVKEQKILVANPEKGGKYPILVPGKHISIYVNGMLLDKPSEVKAEDNIKVEMLDTKPSYEFDLQVSKDKMEAILSLHRQNGHCYELPPQSLSFTLHIEGKVKEQIRPQVSKEDVISFLRGRGIVFGIQENYVDSLLQVDQKNGLCCSQRDTTYSWKKRIY
jgi:uncharacterized protein (DUF342 family)